MAGRESLRYAFLKDLSPLDERIVKEHTASLHSKDDILVKKGKQYREM
jgi:hypothetical protein